MCCFCCSWCSSGFLITRQAPSYVGVSAYGFWWLARQLATHMVWPDSELAYCQTEGKRDQKRVWSLAAPFDGKPLFWTPDWTNAFFKMFSPWRCWWHAQLQLELSMFGSPALIQLECSMVHVFFINEQVVSSQTSVICPFVLSYGTSLQFWCPAVRFFSEMSKTSQTSVIYPFAFYFTCFPLKLPFSFGISWFHLVSFDIISYHLVSVMASSNLKSYFAVVEPMALTFPAGLVMTDFWGSPEEALWQTLRYRASKSLGDESAV